MCCVFPLVPVCQVADPSQAYYQDVTEGGGQQRWCRNETWALANWWHHGVRERERQLPDWQDERRGQRVRPSHQWIKPAMFICRAHRRREHLHSSYQNPANAKLPAGGPKIGTVTTLSTEKSFPFQLSPFHFTLLPCSHFQRAKFGWNEPWPLFFLVFCRGSTRIKVAQPSELFLNEKLIGLKLRVLLKEVKNCSFFLLSTKN